MSLAEQARLRVLLTSIQDWAHLAELAARHRVRLLLYRHLEAAGPGLVPREWLVSIWQHFEHHRRRNQQLAEELLRLLDLLAANGVAAIAYKGPALAQALYGDLALREFDDLDILVRRRDVLTAKGLLQARGYRPDCDLAPAVEAAFLRAHAQYHRVLTHPGTGVMVELHWKTDPDFPVERLDDDAWWGRLTVTTLLGRQVRAFSPTELLLILCLHSTRHQGYRLGWIGEVAVLLRQGGIDWPAVQSQVAQQGSTRRVAVSLQLAGSVLGAELPPAARSLIESDPEVVRLAAAIEHRLFQRHASDLRGLPRLSLSLRLYNRTRHRLAHVLDVAFAPSLHEWSRWPLPRPLFVLYVPLRLFRLAQKYGGGVLGRA